MEIGVSIIHLHHRKGFTRQSRKKPLLPRIAFINIYLPEGIFFANCIEKSAHLLE
jgi:hypothetical protein